MASVTKPAVLTVSNQSPYLVLVADRCDRRLIQMQLTHHCRVVPLRFE